MNMIQQIVYGFKKMYLLRLNINQKDDMDFQLILVANIWSSDHQDSMSMDL